MLTLQLEGNVEVKAFRPERIRSFTRMRYTNLLTYLLTKDPTGCCKDSHISCWPSVAAAFCLYNDNVVKF